MTEFNTGDSVFYRAYEGAEDERGVVIRVTDKYVFVRYNGEDTPKATLREHLVKRCDAVTDTGTPCQKSLLPDGYHAGGHWFMSDDMDDCLREGHYDPANVLSMTPLVHLDVPCDRVVR